MLASWPLVNLEAHDEKTFEAFEKAARDNPHIVECAAVSGNNDYLLKVVVRNITEYEHLLRKTLLKLPGMKGIHSQFVLKQVKNTTKLPI